MYSNVMTHSNQIMVYFARYDDGIFEQIFMETAKSMIKLSENQQGLLIKMFVDKVNNINNINTFINITRRPFAQLVKDHTGIKPGYGAKFHSTILRKLKKMAQAKEFGVFLSDRNMNQINDDYYHLLKVHINNGNKNTVKNVFRF
eukprot:529821_1